MKHVVTIIILIVCAFGQLFGEPWNVVSDYNPQVLYDVSFASAAIGVVVGLQGQVYRSVDGGANWTFFDLHTTETLKTVYFADVNRGFILGNNMYQTVNSGGTWVPMAGPGLPMEGIYFVDNQRGTVVGANGSIFHTTNGGNSWIPQASNASNTLKGVWFTSENTGIIVGEAGIILQTTNGGSSWNRYLSGTLQDLNSIFFLNAATGFISGGNGTILRTTDGGLTWLPAIVESTVVSLLKVKMVDALNGFAFGNSNNFVAPIEFLRTTDGGITWRRQSYGTNRAIQLFGMAVIDPKRCVIVGSSGTIMHTSDGGITWPAQEVMPESDLVGVTGPFSGILSRSFVAASSTGFTFESSSGVTWWMNRYTGRRIRAIHGAGTSLSAHTSIMVGDSGTVVVSHVNETIGSQTTVQLRSDLTLRGVYMVDRDTAYLVADSGYVYKSMDRGSSWTLINSGAGVPLNGICFPDPLNGFAVGEGGLIRRSTDFGWSWIGTPRITSARLNAINFASPDVGVIVGERGTILRTSNGGNTWLVQPGPVAAELRSVLFVNSTRALAVGDSGRIIRTNDGGITWQVQASPVNTALRGIAFLNDTVAVAVGDQRTIVRTTTGVASVAGIVPNEFPSGFILEQNFPNPFNPVTVIRYTVGGRGGSQATPLLRIGNPGPSEADRTSGLARDPGDRNISLIVYDLLGRQVAVLVNEVKQPGTYSVAFDGARFASGVYIYRLMTGSFVQSRTMLLLK